MLKKSGAVAMGLLAGGLLMLAALAAYHNSFTQPFLFDDLWSIVHNPTLQHWSSALSPPSDEGVGGRPFLNLTYALNYAISGDRVWSYHALNLAIHLLAGLTLFGVVRRTLERAGTGGPPVRDLAQTRTERTDGRAARPDLLAFFVALLWIVHPLQTESVTYISQRAESLMGLFYLLTLYGFIRGVEIRGVENRIVGNRGVEPGGAVSPGAVRWLVLSVLCCLAGALCKEIIATAPVIVFLYDRTFVAGSFGEAWRRRWRYYLGLGSVWVLLARLLAGLHRRGVGFGGGVSWWHYALTSCRSVMLYLKLAFWPHPLIIDYGTALVSRPTEALPCALVLAALLAAVGVALRYRPALGFAGAWFFVILAPTSSVIPVPGQPTAEHRLYLSLAAVIALVVVGLHRWLGRRSFILLAALAVGLGALTARRNTDYRSELAIWTDTVAKRPENERAHNGLGYALLDLPGRRPEAIAQFEAAVRIRPSYAEGHYNLGNALWKTPGRSREAFDEFALAVRYKPDYAEAHDSLGNILASVSGYLPQAISEYQAALRLKSDYAEAHNNLGAALVKVPGRSAEAIAEYEQAVRLKPDYPEAHFNLGLVLAATGRSAEAVTEYEAAIRVNPGYAEAQNNLGTLLAPLPGRLPEAIGHFEAAVRSRPDYMEAHFNLGEALLDVPGRTPEAIAEFETVLRLRPDFTPARTMLNRLRAGHR